MDFHHLILDSLQRQAEILGIRSKMHFWLFSKMNR